jgi:archaellum component FlaC
MGVVLELQNISDSIRLIEKELEELKSKIEIEKDPEESQKLIILSDLKEKERLEKIEDLKKAVNKYR